MHISVPKDSGATGVKLMLEDCENSVVAEYPFSAESHTEDYVNYRCDLTLSDCGLYYYWFYLTKAEGGFRLFKQGDQTNMEAGDKWQLSIIPENFTTPDYAKGAVMYQLMPDRFFKKGDCDLTNKLQPYSIHQNWDEEPNSRPDAEGNWCGDFFGGNLQGVQEKLPYLKTLGVHIIYLNPIFMAYSNHRYDTADYKRIDPMLGTEEDFSNLCQEAHKLNIRIVLDGVFSHTGSNSIYFDAKHIFGNGAVSNPESPYRSWYRFRQYPHEYECWWNMPTLPNVEELTEDYVNYIIEDKDSVVAHWLNLGADGFRLDVVDELPDEFVLKLKKRLRQLKPDALLIGEVWEDASNKRAYGVSRRYFVDGELDSVMNYPWRTAILRFVQGEDDGTGFAETVMSLAENYPPHVLSCLMNPLGTHDTARILTTLDENNYNFAKEKLYIAAFLQYTLPGMPCIFYGDEAGLTGGADPFCRRTYPWGREDGELLDYYRSLGKLKNDISALRYGDVRILEAGQGRLVFCRIFDNQKAEVYINLSNQPMLLPAHTLRFGKSLAQDGERQMLLPGGFCLLLSDIH